MIGALIAGDLPDAGAAIKELCPKQQPLLVSAATVGLRRHTEEPEPGTYRALTVAKAVPGKQGSILPPVSLQGPPKRARP
ncbi:hypothetical protein ABZ070_34525 [Streptomyces sp. NPDC006283]|uniref:hypothetical protein n=1 Tax=Streptomyces sp. NPDC006283 TaxID=3156741 RepID=UPI00339E3B51